TDVKPLDTSFCDIFVICGLNKYALFCRKPLSSASNVIVSVTSWPERNTHTHTHTHCCPPLSHTHTHSCPPLTLTAMCKMNLSPLSHTLTQSGPCSLFNTYTNTLLSCCHQLLTLRHSLSLSFSQIGRAHV